MHESLRLHPLEAERYRLDFRADIEGLRAVAILLVVAAHANVPWLMGGFVGVDVFFVLSGYLITALLINEIRATGTVRLTSFYARRLRRLLPALLLMLGCVMAAGSFLLLPVDQPPQAMAAIAAAFWLSNIHLAFMQFDYFAPGADANLFLPTWSLGVEEQFYLIWPALLMVVLWTSGSSLARGRLVPTRVAMVLVFGASLLASLILTQTSPQLAFYSMPTRAWQFALGALVFLHFGAARVKALESQDKEGWSIRDTWTCWLGLALIVGAALWFDGSAPYPGVRSMLPSTGAAIVLVAGMRRSSSGVADILSLRPLQSIGRVSYAWYLWHWPVLVLGATLVDVRSAGSRAILVGLSLLLAVASYHLVEAPLRQSGYWRARPMLGIVSSIVLMLAIASLGLRWQHGAWDRVAQGEPVPYHEGRTDLPIIYSMGCDEGADSSTVRVCAFGPDEAEQTAIAIGDSIALQWFPALMNIFDRPGWRLLVITKSACPMVDGPIFYPSIRRAYTECEKWREESLRHVAELDPDLIFLGSSATYDFDRNRWIEGTSRILESFRALRAEIYVIQGTPTLPFDGPTCIASRDQLGLLSPDENRCTASVRSAESDDLRSWLEEAARRHRNVSVVDMNDLVCPNGQCSAEQEGMIVFRDSAHLTATFARSLARPLGERMRQTSTGDRNSTTSTSKR